MDPSVIDELMLQTSILIRIEYGLKFIMYAISFFLVWKVISILHKLFGGIFFGGI